MADAHKNFAASLVAVAPSPAASGLSLGVTGGDGTKLPAAPFNATVWPAGVQPTTANSEIVRVTAISTDTLTIIRQQEGTSARTIVVGDQISANITAKTLTDAEKVLTGITGGSLNSSTEYIAVDKLEVSATDTFELAATSTLEIEPIINYLIGEITMFGGVQAPAGWFFCDGSTVSRTIYAGLFQIIGTTFGVGDGSTTFTLPDLRGRSPVGAGTGTASGATVKTLGSQPASGSGGEQVHTMTTGELVAHTHPIAARANDGALDGSNLTRGNGTGTLDSSMVTDSTGTTSPFNILQPMSVVNFIIRY